MASARPRDAAASRERILDAAIEEFAAHGIAGARVDRIAAAADLNKALLYSYVGSKTELFDAAFHRAVGRLVDEVPLTVTDLAGYAVALHDRYVEHAELVRLALWDRLERGGSGLQSGPVAEVEAAKVAAIREAQERGIVSNRVTASEVIAIITVLAAKGHLVGTPAATEDEREQQRAALRAAVTAITAP